MVTEWVGVGSCGLGFPLAQRVVAQLKLVGVEDEAAEDGVAYGGVADEYLAYESRLSPVERTAWDILVS